MTIQETINKIEDFVGGNSHEDAMAFTRFLRCELKELCFSQLTEAMGRVEVEDQPDERSNCDYNWNLSSKAWRSRIAAVLEEYKQGLV